MVLIAAFLSIFVWQFFEHRVYIERVRDGYRNRANDISNSLAAVIRSERRFRGLVIQSRLETSLKELVKSDELLSVTLLNAEGRVVASAGESINTEITTLPAKAEVWGTRSVSFVNLIDLGVESQTWDEEEPTIILPIDEERMRDRRPPPWRSSGDIRDSTASIVSPTGEKQEPRERPWEEGRDDLRRERMENGRPSPRNATGENDITAMNESGPRFDRERRFRDSRFPRPPRMSEDDFHELIKKQGLHGFILEMSITQFENAVKSDFWMRFFILGFALIGMAALGVAWRNLMQSSALQLRLVRASEMNTHLREMNLAAAGLAHETRNPLNLVRGLAQMITNENDVSPQIRDQASRITEEVDRVTAQLNEFINYSKPREPKLTSVNISAIIDDVQRTLDTDMEDKSIRYTFTSASVQILADESLLRQIVFNFLLNAIQSVKPGGSIQILVETKSKTHARFIIEDDGPGIAAECRDKIFRPYYTTRESGTGLGLAIVHQIVMAHGWDIECVPVEAGAKFVIDNMKLA
jgi:signal transduction histidine kinase